ncbi:MAG TPA: type II secretory pathway protein ExeA [Desulfovibrio sp.]|jgi:general secretion pathway protein A|nr:type II secretory pathway protein ExeA [Desulfovibrio sp.]
MNYLELLGLSREPFSTSPDPLSYYRAPGHELCLHRLEIAVRLRRGLNVVLGEVGTGKSTLCRCLLRAFAEQPEVTAHLILDPGFASAEAFALHLCELLAGPSASPAANPAGRTGARAGAASADEPTAKTDSARKDDEFGPTPAHITVTSAPAQAPGDAARVAPGSELRREAVERIQTALLRLTQEQGRIVVLCIDESQKLLPECLEVLRELLNFETNTEKLLQIILFGQRELEDTIAALPNFRDRINEYLPLRPLSPRETIRLVRHRLRLAGGPAGERLFTLPALLAVHRATGGYPRKIMRLCHQLVMNLLINNRRRVTWREVNAFASRDAGLGGRLETGPAGLAGLAGRGGPGPLRVAGYVALAALLLGAGMWTGGRMLHGGELHLPWAAKDAQRADAGMAGSTPASAHGAADGGMAGFFRPLLASLGLSGAATDAETGTGTGKDATPANAPGTETRASASVRPQAATPATTGPATALLPGQAPTGTAAAPPARLGMVVLPRGETLLSLLDAVYGRAAAVLDPVLQANPAITNPNRLPSDTILALPAIATEPGMERRGQCALLLESHPTVEEAYRALRAKGGGKRDVVLAPVWKPDRGLRFYLMPPRFYAKPAEAHAASERFIQRFPAATVEPAFGDGAVFYRHFD